MKNLFFSIIALMLFFSCSKEQVTQGTQQQIDKITVVDKNGNVTSEYLYDVQNEMYIGEEPVDKGIVIEGTVVRIRPNSTGGKTYLCSASDEICYSNN